MLNPASKTERGGFLTQVLPVWRQTQASDLLRVEADDAEVLLPSTTVSDQPRSQIPLSFLRRLATDSLLREELTADPTTVLAQSGIQVAGGQIPSQVRLPSAEALKQVLRIYATAEDQAIFLRWVGFLGGLPDD